MGMMDEGRWVNNVPSLPTRPPREVDSTPAVVSRETRLNRVMGNIRKSPYLTTDAGNEIINTILDKRNAER